MKIVVGNKLKEISEKEFQQIKDKFEEAEIDLGTGNGRYVYKNALRSPETLYIGIDPVEKLLRRYSKKAVRKGLKNALFVLTSAEMLSEELKNSADTLNIILPWGSLLGYVANFEQKVILNIKELIKTRGELKIIFGYDRKAEPSETDRLNLEKLNKKYIHEELIPKYENIGFELLESKKLEKEDLGSFETSWSKKLQFGKPRKIFSLEFKKIN